MIHVETISCSRGQAHLLRCEHCGAERYTCDIMSLTGLTCFRCGRHSGQSSPLGSCPLSWRCSCSWPLPPSCDRRLRAPAGRMTGGGLIWIEDFPANSGASGPLARVNFPLSRLEVKI